MNMTLAEWTKYRDILKKIDDKAADEFRDAVFNVNGRFKGVGLANIPRQELIDYGYALITKYGEASAAWACEMYDAIAEASNVIVPAAVPAEIASKNEVGKALNGVLKTSVNEDYVSSVVSRFVKQASQDTTLQNALRDGAQFAWIPAGDTCVFCLTLASRGWQYASKAAIKGGHAEHIHANCDCAYAIRFDDKTNVAGYNPEKYKEMYDNAEGDNSKEKINSMRRKYYDENKDKINAQKREAYALREEADE